MEVENAEYLCSVSFSMVYDPVNIAPTAFLYDRDTVETWIEKNPRNATIPQTRQPFLATDITPNAALRAEMRQYFRRVLGNEYTGWEVIPDYPQLLTLDNIRSRLRDILQFFPTADAEENLRRMSAESWSNAWKRLTFLRVNLQMNAVNRQRFLTNEQPMKSLFELITLSYTRGRKTDESDLFHREFLRTIRSLDLATHQQLMYDLNLENDFRSPQFIGFLFRHFQLEDEGLQPVVLGFFSLIADSLEPKQLLRILEYLEDAEPLAISSTDLRNFARILEVYISSNFTEDNRQLILKMQKRVLQGFVQIVIYAVGIFKSENRIGVVEDACEALHISLLNLNKLVVEGPPEFIETRLAFNIHMDLLTYIHEMIAETVKKESPHWLHLSADDHWLLALNFANILYYNAGNAEIMTIKEYDFYQKFLHSPVVRDSQRLTEYVNFLLEIFRRFVGVWSEVNSTDE